MSVRFAFALMFATTSLFAADTAQAVRDSRGELYDTILRSVADLMTKEMFKIRDRQKNLKSEWIFAPNSKADAFVEKVLRSTPMVLEALTESATDRQHLKNLQLKESSPPTGELSTENLRMATAAMVSHLLRENPTPASTQSLRDVIMFLSTFRPDINVVAVTEGVYLGLRQQDGHLSIEEKSTVLAEAARWIVSGTEERNEPKDRVVANPFGAYVRSVVATLDDAGFAPKDQGPLAGALVKGAIRGLADAGANTSKQMEGIREVVRQAIVATVDTTTDRKQAVVEIWTGALDAIGSLEYSSTQRRKAVMAAAEGLGSFDEALTAAVAQAQQANKELAERIIGILTSMEMRFSSSRHPSGSK